MPKTTYHISLKRPVDRKHDAHVAYEDLGLASYEAMEAFVQYHPIKD